MRFQGIDKRIPRNRHSRVQIKQLIMMGDSLSDRGTLNKKLLFGCISLSKLSGLAGHSPEGRFTNGMVWSDHVSAEIASDFTIKRLDLRPP